MPRIRRSGTNNKYFTDIVSGNPICVGCGKIISSGKVRHDRKYCTRSCQTKKRFKRNKKRI